MREMKNGFGSNLDAKLTDALSPPPSARNTSRLCLYFVAHNDDNGESLDLLVWCETLDGVADHWRSAYELDADEQPDRIFEIPISSPRPGPVGWHIPGHVECIFDKQGRGGARG